MKISLHRLLAATSIVTIAAFLVAAIVRHDKHGFGLYLGDVAWFIALAGAVVVVLLGLVTLARLARRRPATR
jgi:hypothetical protein